MQEACTVNQTVKYMTKKWTLLIILRSTRGKDTPAGSQMRLRDALDGITPKVLSERLKELKTREFSPGMWMQPHSRSGRSIHLRKAELDRERDPGHQAWGSEMENRQYPLWGAGLQGVCVVSSNSAIQE